MRALTTFLLIFSLIFGNLAFAQAVNFKPDPVITVELEESSFTSNFYFYGGIGVGIVLAFVALNLPILRNLLRTPGPLSPRNVPRRTSLNSIISS